jgi:hypothetical protein
VDTDFSQYKPRRPPGPKGQGSRGRGQQLKGPVSASFDEHAPPPPNPADRGREHDLRGDVRAAGDKIKAEPDTLRTWSTDFTSGPVHAPLVNAQAEMESLSATAKPGGWPEAQSLQRFLEQAGNQIAEDLRTMQAASIYLGDALKAVADLQDKHEQDRGRASRDFETAVGRLQTSTGMPGSRPAAGPLPGQQG